MQSKVKLMQGNEACVEGALAAGVRFFAGYPITPATEIMEIMAERLPESGGTFIQMEDEIASMAAVIGASIGGVKAWTASSGPGITLKQEHIGYAAMVEIPCVIVNVQRGGPSTGLPTLPQQADVMQARWGTHGEHPIVVLAPSTVYECYTLTVKAFNIAEQLRTPVILLSDAFVGHLREKVQLPESVEVINRKIATCPPAEYLPFKADADDVPPFVTYGKGYRYHMTSNNHDEGGFPATNNHKIADELMRRLMRKVDRVKDQITFVEEDQTEDAEVIIVAYGCTARSAKSAVIEMRKQGKKVGMIKLMTLWPFPQDVIAKYKSKVKAFIVPELNLGQIVGEVERAVRKGNADVLPINRVDGKLITPEEIIAVVGRI